MTSMAGILRIPPSAKEWLDDGVCLNGHAPAGSRQPCLVCLNMHSTSCSSVYQNSQSKCK